MPITADTLSLTQRSTLKAFILADPTLSTMLSDVGAIATALNAAASPDWWVYKTSLLEADFTTKPSVDSTTWSWPAFIARSVQEQTGWDRLWKAGTIDASQANVRQAFTDIFSNGPTGAAAQRTHCAAVVRRKASRVEKVFATGTGTTGSPGTLDAAAQGDIDGYAVGQALA